MLRPHPTSPICEATALPLWFARQSSRPSMLRIAAAAIGVWLHRASSRRALSMLDDRQLRDIGMTPLAASREAGKPFWRS